MTEDQNNSILLRLSMLTVAVASGPGVLFAVAFLLPQVAYRSFNEFYYGASLIALLAGFGFEIAAGRVQPPARTLLSLIALHTICLGAAYASLPWNHGRVRNVAETMIFAYALAVGGVMTTSHLLAGDLSTFSLLSLLRSAVQCLAFPIYLATHWDFSTVYCVTSGIAALSTVPFYRASYTVHHPLSQLYAIGGSSLLINSAATLGFTIDKYLASQLLSLQQSTSYTFSWSLIAPMFYIGNVFEKLFMVQGDKQMPISKRNAIALYFGILIAYGMAATAVPLVMPSVIPSYLQTSLVMTIVRYMAIGYGIYCLCHFPMNGIVFKHNGIRSLIQLSAGHLVGALVFIVVLICFVKMNWIKQYYQLMFVTWGYLATLLLLKAASIPGHLKWR